MTRLGSNNDRPLTADDERKLRSCLLLWLNNDKDGEALNARGASLKILSKAGIDPYTFVDRAIAGLMRVNFEGKKAPSAPASWRAVAVHCARFPDRLNGREINFVRDLASKAAMYAPSRRQLEWLGAIYEKISGAGHAARP